MRPDGWAGSVLVPRCGHLLEQLTIGWRTGASADQQARLNPGANYAGPYGVLPTPSSSPNQPEKVLAGPRSSIPNVSTVCPMFLNDPGLQMSYRAPLSAGTA
jgi:hypothetical protein